MKLIEMPLYMPLYFIMQSIIINVCNSRKFGFSAVAMTLFKNRITLTAASDIDSWALRRHPTMIDIVHELGGIQSGLFGANLQVVTYPIIAENYMTISDDGYDVHTDTTHHAEYLVFDMVKYKFDAIKETAFVNNATIDDIRVLLCIPDFVATPLKIYTIEELNPHRGLIH
jgi:hypothetical protein